MRTLGDAAEPDLVGCHDSVLIATNLPFSGWVQVLGDERLTFRCHILEFLGDSFRFRHGLVSICTRNWLSHTCDDKDWPVRHGRALVRAASQNCLCHT